MLRPMRRLVSIGLCVVALCAARVGWAQEVVPLPPQEATPAAEAAPAAVAAPAAEEAPAAEAAPEEPAGPTDVVVVASGGTDVTEDVLSQARLAAVAAAAARRDYHGRVVRSERDPGIALRASDCPDDACLVAVGRDAASGYLFVLMLERAEVGHRATVLLVDVTNGVMAGSAAFDLPADAAAFTDAVRDPLGPLVAAISSLYPQVGRIVVDVDQPGAEVFLDGQRVGTAPLDPLAEIDPGTHSVRVEAEGYSVFEQTVEVVAGEDAQVAVAMIPASSGAPLPPPTPVWRRWWFWTAIGVVVVGAGLGVGLGVGLSGEGDTRTEYTGVEFPTFEQR